MTAREFREFSKKELFKRLDKMNLGKDEGRSSSKRLW